MSSTPTRQTNSKTSEVECGYCKNIGHTKESCPMDVAYFTPREQIGSGIPDNTPICIYCKNNGHTLNDCPKLY